MLSDRSYMRTEYPRQNTSVLTWILCATFAASVIQFAMERFGNSNAFEALMALSPYGLQQMRFWTVATYALLHGNILHLLLNALGIFLIGREVAPLLGGRRFLAFYIAAAVVGGLAWLGVHYFTSTTSLLVGASACLAAIFILFACIYPEREITFLLFFVLPITLKPKILAWILLGVDTLGFIFSELPGGRFDSGVAHSAHLGGMLTGWLYYRYFHANAGLDRAAGPVFELPKWLRKSDEADKPAPPPRSRAQSSADASLRAEVDRILDKINSQGFGALTDDEKRLLDEAKDLLSRR